MSNIALQRAMQRVKRLYSQYKDTVIGNELFHLYCDIQRGIYQSEVSIDDALRGVLRHSDFYGDEVGRPADDFDEV